jgi:hypothetical protein
VYPKLGKFTGILVEATNADDVLSGQITVYKKALVEVTRPSPSDASIKECEAFICNANDGHFSPTLLNAISLDPASNPYFFIMRLDGDKFLVANDSSGNRGSIMHYSGPEKPRDILIEMAKEPALSKPFAAFFPDLAKFSEGLEDLPSAKLEKFLSKAEQENNKELDLLTIKVPRELIFAVTAPAMLVIAYIIMLYGLQFRRYARSSTEVGVMDLYYTDIYLNPVVTILGLVTIPLASLAVQAWRLLRSNEYILMVVVATIGSLALSLLVRSSFLIMAARAALKPATPPTSSKRQPKNNCEGERG